MTRSMPDTALAIPRCVTTLSIPLHPSGAPVVYLSTGCGIATAADLRLHPSGAPVVYLSTGCGIATAADLRLHPSGTPVVRLSCIIT
jgi:hypothetical protein